MYRKTWYLTEGRNDIPLNKQYKNLSTWKKGKIRIISTMLKIILQVD